MPYYNPGLPHCGQILYQLSCKGSPRILEWVACPFSSRSSRPRNRTRVSCIAGWFFTNWAIRAPSYFCKCQVMLCPLPIMSIFLWGGENKLQASQARKRKYQWKGMPKQISFFFFFFKTNILRKEAIILSALFAFNGISSAAITNTICSPLLWRGENLKCIMSGAC